MSELKKPREWMIYENDKEPCLAFTSISWAMEDLGQKKSDELIEVIEKSAYLKAIEALKEAHKFLDENNIDQDLEFKICDLLLELGVIE